VAIGRIYETRGGPDSLRWFWSMTVNGPMTRSDRVAEGVGESGGDDAVGGSSAFVRARKVEARPPFKAIEASWEVESLFAPEERRQHASRFVHPQIGSEFEKPFV